MEMTEKRIKTFGQQLVGLDFEPDDNPKVQRVKELFAEAADILKEHYETENRAPITSLLFDHTVGEILNAQMNVVKVITFKG